MSSCVLQAGMQLPEGTGLIYSECVVEVVWTQFLFCSAAVMILVDYVDNEQNQGSDQDRFNVRVQRLLM